MAFKPNKWMLIAFGAALGLSALTAGTLVAINAYDKQQPVTQYAGFALDMSKDEVLYENGEPQYVFQKESDGLWSSKDITELPTKKDVKSYNFWAYGEDNSKIIILRFTNETQKVIFIRCITRNFHSTKICPDIKGIAAGDTEKKVKDTFGKPSEEKIADGVKSVIYKKQGVIFRLHKKKVNSVSIGIEPTS